MNHLLDSFANNILSKEEVCTKVEQDFSLVSQIVEGVYSQKPAVRYGCSKVLMDLSEKHPQKLYPFMIDFIKLLDNKYRIVTWNAIFIVANLAQVDEKQKFDAIFDKYFSYLKSGYMVTVANVVVNSVKIARAKPYLIGKITKELLKVESISITPHLTDECKRVIIAKTIHSLNLIGGLVNESKVEVNDFVKRQLNSSREGVRKEAELFFDRWK